MQSKLVVLAIVAVAWLAIGGAAGAASHERRGKLPTLTQPKAERYAKQSIQSEFEAWSYYNGKLIRCNKRKSRIRMRCKVKWWVGDASFEGKVTVWYRWRRGDVMWYSRGKVNVLNEYCVSQGGSKEQCTDTTKWRY